MMKDPTSVVAMVPREEENNLNRLWTQEEEIDEPGYKSRGLT